MNTIAHKPYAWIHAVYCPLFVTHTTPCTMNTNLCCKTKPELIQTCNQHGLTYNSKMTKTQLIGLIQCHQTNQDHDESDATLSTTLPKLRMVDLFAGTGAFSLAFQSTDQVEVVFSNDMVPHSKTIYDTNFGHELTLQNLNDVNVDDIPPHHILTGGFPCQPFSIAGLREGFNDERSNVFWKILAIIDRHQPACVILENVKNLISHDAGRTFETITTNLESRGYKLRYKVLNTAEITGIPHHRERIYLVCIRSEQIFDAFHLDFPCKDKRPISDLLESSPVPDKYYYTDKSSTWNLVKESVVKPNTVYQYRRVYVRENKSGVCPTLTANMGAGGHNVPLILDPTTNRIRKLTPRECFRFQGFPDTYILPPISDSNLYKLAGNAVSVPVVQQIAHRIIPLLQAELQATASLLYCPV